EANPAYTRTGSRAGSPVNRSISAAEGPSETKRLPTLPSESQVTSEASLPDRSGVVGGLLVASVSWLIASNVEFNPLMSQFASTPFARVTTSHAAKATPATAATRRGRNRRTPRTHQRATHRKA